MTKYKLCPCCKTKNAPTVFECVKCETDLSKTRVTDEETEQKAQEQAQQQSSTAVRVCEECGFENPANARKCAHCGEDISHIQPRDKAEPEPVRFTIASLDGEYALSIPVGETVLGKEAVGTEYLAKKSYVSRVHGKLTVSEGKLYYDNLSRTNYSYVNNTKITNEQIELHDGDELALGGFEENGKRPENAAFFLVRIGTCM